ncbi:MAG TPA: hypothetical protein VMR14_02810 [Streptosporangiaceae bacterium]|nr:hypothetical protein [Streptosporangiaceae bacterium]
MRVRLYPHRPFRTSQLALLALVHAELGSTYPVSGGTARFPFMVFGALGDRGRADPRLPQLEIPEP